MLDKLKGGELFEWQEATQCGKVEVTDFAPIGGRAWEVVRITQHLNFDSKNR